MPTQFFLESFNILRKVVYLLFQLTSTTSVCVSVNRLDDGSRRPGYKESRWRFELMRGLGLWTRI